MKTHNNKPLAWLAGLVATVLAWPAAGARLEVRVVRGDDGRPLSGAAVCLGTQASPAQFGALRTGDDGVAAFDDLPHNGLVLTVSRPGFRGSRRSIGPGEGTRLLVLKLATGGGGPQCEAGAAAPAADAGGQGLRILSLKVGPDPSGDPRRVVIHSRVSGKATHIRVAETPDFAGAAWQPYTGTLAYRLGRAGGRRLYVQVRRHARTNGASLELLSPVRSLYYGGR